MALAFAFTQRWDAVQRGELRPRSFAFQCTDGQLTKQRTMTRWPSRQVLPYMTPTARTSRRYRVKPAMQNDS